MTTPQLAELHEPLTTKEGWHRFVDHPGSSRPEAISDEVTVGHEDARLAYHSQLAVVATPAVQQITAAGRRLVVLNRQQLSARRGLIVTGAAGTGKTTAITQLCKAHELALRLHHPQHGPRLPVIYITVPPAATPRMLVVEFARFLALTMTGRSNVTDITEAVCAVLIDLGCQLVVVDELHNLNLATRSGAEVSDQAKYLAERLPDTFIYAGIDVERVGLFAGTRGRQIASRFAILTTKPFGYSPLSNATSGAHSWRLEQNIQLHRHRPGTLVGLAAHLHDRIGGMIGSLSHLLRAAAIDAIISGDEQVTKAGLAAVQLDHAAEAPHRHHSKPRPARTIRTTR